ncbi:MAG: hypothetical protein ABIT37_01245 [Luteolibacter sp.]
MRETPRSRGEAQKTTERPRRFDSGSWTPVGDAITGTGNVIQITDTNGAGQTQRFYRLVVK